MASDFQKEVVKVVKDAKTYVNNRIDVDPGVKEQVNSDFEKVIEKHENAKNLDGKYWKG